MNYNCHVFAFQTAVIFTFCSLVLAQFYDPNSPTISKGDKSIRWGQYIYCPCSPTNRGFSQKTLEAFDKLVKARQEIIDRAKSGGTKGDALVELEVSTALVVIDACRRVYRAEACINVDLTLRNEGKQFCAYHGPTGLNVYNYTRTLVKYVARCNQHRVTTSPPEHLRTSTPSPSPTDGKKIVGNMTEENGPKPFNEDCVAIEHLRGYVLQHRRHVMRTVLCSRGFCATPNHLIIIDGKRTSMKLLCSTGEWKCVLTTKLVNNLKIAANTRAQVGDIVITPYDIRYPVFLIWAVQIAEDVLYLVSTAAISGLLSTTLLYIWGSFQNKKGFPHKVYPFRS